MIDLSPLSSLLESLVRLANRQLDMGLGQARALGQVRDASVGLAKGLPRMLLGLQRAVERLHEQVVALERMLSAQIRAAGTMAATWSAALRTQLSSGVTIRLDSETQGLLALQGRNLGWSLRDIVRALRPLSRISFDTGQLVIHVREVLRWLRRISEQLRALHAMLHRKLDRIADILIEGFRSLRLILWAGFSHTFAWLRLLGSMLAQVLAGLRVGFGVLDAHTVSGFWFVISWLQAIFRQLRDWGMEGLFRTLARLSGLADMPIEQILSGWVTALFEGVLARVQTMADGIIEAVNALGEKICGCQGGEEEEPSWWDQIWEWGEGFLKDGLWKGITWGLKKLTPWGRVVDWTMWGLDQLGVKDWLWDKTKQGASWLWETGKGIGQSVLDPFQKVRELIEQKGGSTEPDYQTGPLALAGWPGMGGPVVGPLFDWKNFGRGGEIPKPEKKYQPTLSDLYNLMPRSIPEPPDQRSYLQAADRITRMQDNPLKQMAMGGVSGGAGVLMKPESREQHNQFHATVNITVPVGTPQEQVDYMSNQMRRVFDDQWNRQLQFASEQFLDATTPEGEHVLWKGQ